MPEDDNIELLLNFSKEAGRIDAVDIRSGALVHDLNKRPEFCYR
jgi:hypothetical protein